MRERRAAGDPYWSYSGEPPFMLGHGLRSPVGGGICVKYRFSEEQNTDCSHQNRRFRVGAVRVQRSRLSHLEIEKHQGGTCQSAVH